MKNKQKILFVPFLLMLFQGISLAQNDSINLSLLITQDFRDSNLEYTKVVKYGITSNKTFIQRANPVTFVFSGLMFFYQKMLSQQISADCLYSPSCSEYTRKLFVRYGFIKGLIFSSDRIMRCDRISATTINHISIDSKDGKIHETEDRYKLNSPNL
jgi:putative component of membrane protein insertase Oxa1/YidC/SpoIIIJ protein YidD